MRESSPDVLLRIQNLNAAYASESGHLRVVRDWTMSLPRGEVAGILGESGSGKTTSALAILGLLPRGAVVSGSVCFQGVELIGATESTLQKIRGAQISLIQQEPLLSLNPVIRVIDQVAEVLRAHGMARAAEGTRRARTALQRAGLADESLHNAYPHQLSGGQRQRVSIAQAIVCGPSLVIADEPTGALDAVSTLEILQLLRNLVRELNASLILITHDPRLAAAIADRVLIVNAASIVETGPAREVLARPLHPYTQALLRCLRGPLKARCIPTIDTPLLSVRRVSKAFYRRGKLTTRRTAVQALVNVNLELQASQTVAVVGPSGAGKSTLARCIAGLEQPDSGEVLLDGRRTTRDALHRRIQVIFQDPGASLNPRFTVEEALAEPLVIRTKTRPARSGILERLHQVGLPDSVGARLTSQLSGGQKARLALARALAAFNDRGEACILILDESLSSLDLLAHDQMIKLLLELQQQRALSYILIAHDLSLVARLADQMLVLREGRAVESGAPQALFESPMDAEWQQLVAATRALESGQACTDV